VAEHFCFLYDKYTLCLNVGQKQLLAVGQKIDIVTQKHTLELHWLFRSCEYKKVIIAPIN